MSRNKVRSFLILLLASFGSGLAASEDLQMYMGRTDPQAIKERIAANPKWVKARDASGWTPLHWACKFGMVSVVEALLAAGADVNTTTRTTLYWGPYSFFIPTRTKGEPPLAKAFLSGHNDVVYVLLAHGADCGARDSDNHPIRSAAGNYGPVIHAQLKAFGGIFAAVTVNDSKKVAGLLSSDPASANAKDADGGTPLHWAARCNRVEMARLLLNRQARVDETDSGSETPMHLAAYHGHEDMIRILIEYKADVNARDRDGCTPLHYAAWQGEPEVIGLLADAGANPSLKNRDGLTPIHLATMMAILYCWEKPPYSDMFYFSYRAYSARCRQAVATLVKHGADVNAATDGGFTPLHAAAASGTDSETVKFLLAHGADRRAQLASGVTAFETVASLLTRHPRRYGGYGSMYSFMIGKYKAGQPGWTPMHYVGWSGNKDVAEAMVADGAAVFLKDRQGKTPSQIAQDFRNNDMALALSFFSTRKIVKTEGLLQRIVGKDGSPMVLVPAGEFLMGSPAGVGAQFEHPQHKVYLDAYYIDVCQVTVGQYRKFCEATGRKMPDPPEWGWGEEHPVENVSWDDATAYAEHYGKRLPTEAEWEKACRAGTTTIYCFGDDVSELPAYAWCGVESRRRTHPVGKKKPNPWGIYDMHGDHREWCADRDSQSYKKSWYLNPQGSTEGIYRVVRGGPSAARGGWYPNTRREKVGFRCAQTPTGD